MTVDEIVAYATRSPGWELLERRQEAASLELPNDLRAFLERAGGLRTPRGVEIGARLLPAQDAILGERVEEDRSANWVILAEEDDSGTALRVVIDLDPDRLGRIYDAFWDRFAVAGAMPVVARSFSEFLDRLVAADGEPFWADDELQLGDAYD